MQFAGALMGLILIAVVLTSPLWVLGLVTWAVVALSRSGRRPASTPRAHPAAWTAPGPCGFPAQQVVHLHHHQQLVLVQASGSTTREGRRPVVIEGAPVGAQRPELTQPQRERSVYDGYCRPADPGQR